MLLWPAKVEDDLVDLAETACDLVADSLGLTEEQVQLRTHCHWAHISELL